MSTSLLSASIRLPRVQALGVPVHPELLALLGLAAVLNLWSLDSNGYANEYYAAAVRSMTESWHAFASGSFDAAGVMTVDKPPLALWVQALSARIFGFSSWSLLAPQALMGVATVGLTYADVAAAGLGHERQLDLVADFDYNGLGRLVGQQGGRAGPRPDRAVASSGARPARCGCSTMRSAVRQAGSWASRSSRPWRCSPPAGCGARTRARVG